MAQLAIVNAPSSFTTIWSFIKPWLAKETVAKVDVLGSDYQDVLLSLIDAENLPAALGGTCQCEEGCEHSNAGPWSEGRKERREKFLRGEGPAGVQVDAEALKGSRGTLEEDEEERQRREQEQQSSGSAYRTLSFVRSNPVSRQSSKRSSLASTKSKPIDIPQPSNDKASSARSQLQDPDHDDSEDASSQSTQTSSPGPSTPPLDLSSDMSGLTISSSSSSSSEEGVRRQNQIPTTPKMFGKESAGVAAPAVPVM